MLIRLLLFVVCMLMVHAGEAQAQLFLENGKVVLSVSGGEHLNGSLLIHNTSAKPIEVRVYWEDFQYKEPYDGSKSFFPAGTAPGSASQWVTFSPPTFTLPPFGQQRIDYTVAAPPQITEGHYGVLFFECNNGPMTNDNGISLVTRVGCLFFIEPSQKNKKALIQDIKLQSNNLTANFINEGNIVLIPKITYYVMGEGGLVLFRGDVNKIYVPPGAKASMTIPMKERLKPGKYSLVVNADLEEGDVVVKEIAIDVDSQGQLTIESVQD